MKFLTTKGKIITGESPQEILENLKNSSPYDRKKRMDKYLETLSSRIRLYDRAEIKGYGHVEILMQLEEVGFLLRLE